jgi:hypothetical protein
MPTSVARSSRRAVRQSRALGALGLSALKLAFPAKRRIRWTDLHDIDPATFPHPSTHESGAYQATVLGVAVRCERTGTGRLWWLRTPDGGGSHGRTLQEAREVLAKAVAMARSSQLSLSAALQRIDAKRSVARWMRETVGLFMDGEPDAPAAARRRRATMMDDVALNLEAFAREMRRRGYAIQQDGSVRQTWKELARGRWTTDPGLASADEDQPTARRIENGHVLEVWREGRDEGPWLMSMDGCSLGEVETSEEDARAFAVRAARGA